MSEIPAELEGRACNSFTGPTYYCLVCGFEKDKHTDTWESTSSTMERQEIEPRAKVVEIKTNKFHTGPLVFNDVIHTEESRSFYTVVLQDESVHKIAISNISEIKEEFVL